MSAIPGLDCAGPLHPKAIEGLELFNQGKYWHAHEALEAAWREEEGRVRELYQGVLQAGVVYLHITRANYPGAVKVYGRCLRWLEKLPERCRGVEVGSLRQDLRQAMDEVQRLGAERLAEFDRALLKPVRYTLTEEKKDG